jgi:hypothetical protein
VSGAGARKPMRDRDMRGAEISTARGRVNVRLNAMIPYGMGLKRRSSVPPSPSSQCFAPLNSPGGSGSGNWSFIVFPTAGRKATLNSTPIPGLSPLSVRARHFSVFFGSCPEGLEQEERHRIECRGTILMTGTCDSRPCPSGITIAGPLAFSRLCLSGCAG